MKHDLKNHPIPTYIMDILHILWINFGQNYIRNNQKDSLNLKIHVEE